MEIQNGYNGDGSVKARGIFENRIWVDSKEAADYLRISVGSLRNAVYRKQVVAGRFRRRLYFRITDLNRLLEASLCR